MKDLTYLEKSRDREREKRMRQSRTTKNFRFEWR